MEQERVETTLKTDFPVAFKLQPVSLIVLDKERALVGPIVFNAAKQYIKLEFIRGGLESVWAVPIWGVSKIIYSVIPHNMIWIALEIPPLPGQQIDENPFPVIFTLGHTDRDLQLIKGFFQTACSEICVSEVDPCAFYNTVGAEAEDFLLYDLFYEDQSTPADDENEEEKSVQKEVTGCNEDEISSIDTDGKVIVKFPNGQRRTIRYESLCKSLDDNGWFCDDLIDIAIENMVQEKLSLLPHWKEKIVIYDTLFFPKIKRYAKQLAAVNRQTHPVLMQLLYPLKNTHLMSFCSCPSGLHRNVPEFKKELIAIPVCCRKHWLLVLVHKPMDAIRDDGSEYLDIGEKKRCRIIILDSLQWTTDKRKKVCELFHEEIYSCIKNWLNMMHYHDGWTEEPNVTTGYLKVVPTNLPKQPNSNDCGIYLLKFFEEFVLEDWTWTDWHYNKLKTMTVRRPDEMHTEVTNYRIYIHTLIERIAVNLPKMPANLGDV